MVFVASMATRDVQYDRFDTDHASRQGTDDASDDLRPEKRQREVRPP